MQKLPYQPTNTDHAVKKKKGEQLQQAADHHYKQIPHDIPDPAVEQKNRKSEMKIRERKGHNS